MSHNATHSDDGSDNTTDLSDRDVRALTEYMTVIPEGGNIYTVVGQNGNGEYRVDAQAGRCTCNDATYNLDDDEQCKHERRVEFATGTRAIPAWADTDAIDPQLGDHVDGSPRRAVADGGTTLID